MFPTRTDWRNTTVRLLVVKQIVVPTGGLTRRQRPAHPRMSSCDLLRGLVPLLGLEPRTHRLRGGCSNQLSYRGLRAHARTRTGIFCFAGSCLGPSRLHAHHGSEMFGISLPCSASNPWEWKKKPMECVTGLEPATCSLGGSRAANCATRTKWRAARNPNCRGIAPNALPGGGGRKRLYCSPCSLALMRGDSF